jgi:arylsulfatase
VGNDPSVLPGPFDVLQSYGMTWANASNTPFRRFKHWVHEGGIATPLIAYWPAGIKQASITHQPGHIIDIMATCLDVAGASYPKTYKDRPLTPLEGKSLLPNFAGKTREGHDIIGWEHEGNRALRQGKWKLVAVVRGQWELYDLEADRTERNNLAAKEPAKVKELAALYQTWADKVGVVPWEKLSGGR